MPVQKLRSRQDQRDRSSQRHERPIGFPSGPAGGLLAEVVTLEHALKRALGPLATAALARDCELVCEVMPDVGEYVLGERRQFTDVVGRIAAEAVSGAFGGGDVHVRVARQCSGFAPSDTILVSVSIRRGDTVEDTGCIEVRLPLAERADEVDQSGELAGTRVLVVVPNKNAARVHAVAARRFGAVVESILDASLAHEKLRDANESGAPFDVLFLDDTTPNLPELIRTLPDSAFGNARRILATAIAESPLRRAFAAGVDQTLSKPVLPHELCEAIVALRGPAERLTTPAPTEARLEARPEGGGRRRASGMRNLRLAEVLASLAVAAPSRRAR